MPGVDTEVHLGKVRVVAHDLELGDVRQRAVRVGERAPPRACARSTSGTSISGARTHLDSGVPRSKISRRGPRRWRISGVFARRSLTGLRTSSHEAVDLVRAYASRSRRTERDQLRPPLSPSTTPGTKPVRATSVLVVDRAVTVVRPVRTRSRTAHPRAPRTVPSPAAPSQVVRLGHAGARDPGEPLLAHGAQVRSGSERVERMVAADVARGLLSADVLLAGRERQHEGRRCRPHPPSARQVARASVRTFRSRACEEPEARSAERHRVAERLALAYDDVGTDRNPAAP